MPLSEFPSTIRVMRLPLLALAVATTSLMGCSTVEYLWQAGRGQLALFNHARPIDDVIRDTTTPPRIRALLLEVPKVKAFGERFGMKPTRNYEEYVKLDRDAVVYVVSACHPLRFEPKEWKFPIVGGFPYLGFYAREGADRYASKLREENLDVDVRGAPAYSTLGWFRDPILSTMIRDGNEAAGELAEVVIHESVHATVYINHQAFFNESLASFVSEGLTPLYLAESRGVGSAEEKEYRAGLEWQVKFFKRMHEAYVALEGVYQSSDTDTGKLQRKDALLAALRTDVKWGPNRTLNNATLIGFREYGGNRGTFDRLFTKCGRDWPRFMKALGKIKSSDFPESQTKDLSRLEANFRCD